MGKIKTSLNLKILSIAPNVN